MNPDYLDAVANRSGGYTSQNDFLADEYQRLGDLNRGLTQQISGLNFSGIGSGPRLTELQTNYLNNRQNLMDQLGRQWARSFGTNRTYNTGPITSPDMQAMNANIQADRQRADEAQQQVARQAAYAKQNINPEGVVDANAVRQNNYADTQAQDILGQATKSSMQKYYVPGVGYTDTQPYQGYGQQSRVGRQSSSVDPNMAEIDSQLANGTRYNGAASGVPAYALARQSAIDFNPMRAARG